MIMKPYDWDQAEVFTGARHFLPSGLYVCRIVDAMPIDGKLTDKQTGKRVNVPALEIYFDIAGDSEFAGWFSDMHARFSKSAPVPWPYDGRYRQNIETPDGHTNGYFKGMIHAIEMSNNGYFWDWQEKSLIGREFGGVIQRQETHNPKDGKWYWNSRLIRIVASDALCDEAVPQDKARPKSQVQGAEVMPDEDIPF